MQSLYIKVGRNLKITIENQKKARLDQIASYGKTNFKTNLTHCCREMYQQPTPCG